MASSASSFKSSLEGPASQASDFDRFTDRRRKRRMRPSGPGRRPGDGGAEHHDSHARDDSPSEDSFDDEDVDEFTGEMQTTFLSQVAGSSEIAASSTIAKPKRTRQLTTPYQAEELHKVLAQSRFPPTAMREEVGRRIGLSPRRVQVWFQNQRQKAKKKGEPHTTESNVQSNLQRSSIAPSNRAHGEFPMDIFIPPGPDAGSSTASHNLSSHVPSASDHRPSSSVAVHPSSGTSDVSHEPDQRFRMSRRLIGPGVPGTTMDPYPIRRANSPSPRHTPTIQGRQQSATYMQHGSSYNRNSPDQEMSSAFYPNHSRAPEPPLRLPPLSIITSGSTVSRPLPRNDSPRVAYYHGPEPLQRLPPPYTLEPSPVWAAPIPSIPPTLATPSTQVSSSIRQERRDLEPQHPDSTGRLHRYDPVRNNSSPESDAQPATYGRRLPHRTR